MKDNFCSYINKGMRLHFEQRNHQLYFLRKPCCHLQNSFSPPELNEFIPINSAKDIFKHISYNWYKDYIKNNTDLPKQCFECYNDENNGNSSSRTYINNRHYNGEFDNYDINRLDIVLGNTCNLACPFCSSYSSSLIEKITKNLEEPPFNWKTIKNTQPDPFQLSTIIADILKEYKVHTLKVIGGEPFLKENWDSIGRVLDLGVATDCTFEVTTNGTILNHKILDSLSKLKQTRMLISVDSIGRNYDFIRWPHTWSRMEKNIKFLIKNCPDNVEVKIATVACIFNLEYLPALEQVLLDNDVKYNFNSMIKPDGHPLNCENLPQDIIDSVKEKLVDSRLKANLISNPKVSKESVKKQTQIFLNQRNMKAEEVLGPMTREWLGL